MDRYQIKWIYSYGNGKSEGKEGMKNLLGGKGLVLQEMCRIGLPVPPGFTITTEACNEFYICKQRFPQDFDNQLKTAIKSLEQITGKNLGDPKNPLLLSVRSGARVSMPGMMDTILNLGLNEKTVIGLSNLTNNPRFAYDCYRRFIQAYGHIVMKVNSSHFEHVLANAKKSAKVSHDYELNIDELNYIIKEYKEIVKRETKEEFPEDTKLQLDKAISAVFLSWNTERANTYRKLNNIPYSWGTAVNVVSMVFGNMGNDCGTGVAFTRNPSTGENAFYGEYLTNAQGEDVVAGIRTPMQVTIKGKLEQKSIFPSMEEKMPNVYEHLCKIRHLLEKHYKDMQDIEFTIEKGKLYILQSRNGKRTGQAGLKIAVDMCQEGLITVNEALLMVNAGTLNQLLHPRVEPNAQKEVLTRGLPASPGACSGEICFSAEEAEVRVKQNKKVILVREDTCPDDIHGMHVAQGILTSRGGMTSHAAVVARGMGRPCICGAGDIIFNHKEKYININKNTFKEGDFLTLDGNTGEVLRGQVKLVEGSLSNEYNILMSWADKVRRLAVRANAETPKDVKAALKFGAEGIGLVRTEHMFFEPKRILAIRKMFLADSESEKTHAIEELLPFQTSDFLELFKLMTNKPITIRLLDPPMHEFLPKEEYDLLQIKNSTNLSLTEIKNRCKLSQESNPMLGNRGARLLITRPEVTAMQARAIFTAAAKLKSETGNAPIIEIMIPLVFSKREIDICKEIIDNIAQTVMKSENIKLQYLTGTMIELPRAALVADEIALSAEFFSFGTNDLTQTTYGISRDDVASFINNYKQQGVIEYDPFTSIDEIGVGQLMKLAVSKGKSVNKDVKLGICGEHGGDPTSIRFADKIGLDYVSCSPFRIPIARLAAAQAFILNQKESERELKEAKPYINNMKAKF